MGQRSLIAEPVVNVSAHRRPDRLDAANGGGLPGSLLTAEDNENSPEQSVAHNATTQNASGVTQRGDVAERIEQTRSFNAAVALVPQAVAGMGGEEKAARLLASVETIVIHRTTTPKSSPRSPAPTRSSNTATNTRLTSTRRARSQLGPPTSSAAGTPPKPASSRPPSPRRPRYPAPPAPAGPTTTGPASARPPEPTLPTDSLGNRDTAMTAYRDQRHADVTVPRWRRRARVSLRGVGFVRCRCAAGLRCVVALIGGQSNKSGASVAARRSQ